MAIILIWTASFAYFLHLRSQTQPFVDVSKETTRGKIEDRKVIIQPAKQPIHEDNIPQTPTQGLFPEGDDRNIHIVFSTDCSFFQDWQSLMVFHSAVQVKQKGEVTRIASGCDEAKKLELTTLYQKLYPQYHVHFTPDFKRDGKTNKKYDFYNKPYGLHHWLQFSNPAVRDGTVVILIDPDMIILRPLTLQVAGYPTLLTLPNYNANDIPPKYVKKGHPAAQIYGLGAPWTIKNKNFNRTDVCGVGSPCLQVNRIEGEKFYSVGPPYLVEKDDLLRLTDSWTRFVPK